MALEYKTKCREVFGQLIEHNKAFFEGSPPYYDLQSIMFSIKNFSIQGVGTDGHSTFLIARF